LEATNQLLAIFSCLIQKSVGPDQKRQILATIIEIIAQIKRGRFAH
jgi:hypothetical protein